MAARAIAAVDSHAREITPREYDWANDGFFKGTLSPRDKILLTDTRGYENGAFTFPRSDGKIVMCIRLPGQRTGVAILSSRRRLWRIGGAGEEVGQSVL